MFKYRKALAASVFLGAAAMVTPAMSADPTYWDQPSPAFNWSGFYVGAHGGWGSGNYDYIFPNGQNVGSSLSGGFGGIQAGYNWDFGGVIVGAEGDLSFGNIGGTSVCPNAAFSCNVDVNFLSTVRGRVGLPLDNVMPYVTAGVAFGNVRRRSSDGAQSLSDSRTLTGWTAGLGAEVAVMDGWSIGGEYLYVDLGRRTFPGTGPAFSDVRIGTQMHTFRLKANFRW
ncbi:MAG: outer membrane protein [Rhizobiaceae bacterium]